MTVWSLTPFSNELDILEIRLAELDPVVDVHVIAESTLTFSGDPKPLHYAENRERFSPWLDKIRHVIVDDAPTGRREPDNPRELTACESDRWRRENHQRDALIRGCDGMGDDDVVLLSDVDEIPRADVFGWAERIISGRVVQAARPPLGLYMYFMNWRWLLPPLVVARFVHGNTLRSLGPERTRHLIGQPFGSQEAGSGLGWHFSYLGGVDSIRYKLRTAAHHEVNVPPYNTEDWIADCLATGRDLFGRRRPMVSVPILELPAHIRANSDRFGRHFGPELPVLTQMERDAMVSAWHW